MVKVADSQMVIQNGGWEHRAESTMNENEDGRISTAMSSEPRRGSVWEFFNGKGCLEANPVTNTGRKAQLAKIILVTVIPICILLVQTLVIIGTSVTDVNIKKAVKEEILFSIETGKIVHYLQIERGATSLYITSSGEKSVLDLLSASRMNTDRSIEELPYWPQYVSI